jgi:hypothetical protein
MIRPSGPDFVLRKLAFRAVEAIEVAEAGEVK